MREKLNDNPVAQIALIAVLALLGGYLVLSSMGGESSGAATESSAAVEGAEATSDTSAVAAPVDGKLPHPVEAAYRDGKTIVLLVYRPGGVEDAGMAVATRALRTMPQVAFFPVSTKRIARYSAITAPIGVNQTPALVVVRARRGKGKAPAPASAYYGFLGPREIHQAVIDANYTGPEGSYAPN